MNMNGKQQQLEIWVPIKGYEGLYEVSNLGRVKSLDKLRNFRYVGFKNPLKGKLIKGFDAHGYRRVSLCKNGKYKKIYIHVLVARAFIPNPENKPEVNHKDGIKINNRELNLEWNTNKENRDNAVKMGLMIHGSNHHRAKLSESQVLLIRKQYSKGISGIKIAKEYNMNASTIYDIINRTHWKYV